LFTKIYKSAQKFLSTKPAQRFWLALRDRFRRMGMRIAAPFYFLRQSRKAQIVFFVSLLLPPLLVFALTVILPAVANPFEEPAGEEIIKRVALPTDSALAEIFAERRELALKMASLQIDQAFWQARLQLAKGDSISLAVDLIDSVASLEAKGVVMRRCEILRYRSSGLTRRWRSQGRLHQWLASPFMLEKELATLPKAPIRIKEAPRDTIEASESKGEDLPIEQRDAEFTLHFDRNLSLFVEQAQAPSFRGRWREFWYNVHRTFGAAEDALVDLLLFRPPQHRIWIEIELSREDAKAIYRALPHRAGLALRL
jgi:hypothetical protein